MRISDWSSDVCSSDLGKSIVTLAAEKYGIRDAAEATRGSFMPFSAQTRMSGLDLDNREIRKGAMDAVLRYAATQASADLTVAVERIAKSGGTPLVVSVDRQILGVIHLKDIVKTGIRERFAELRRMGIRTVMITGDNPLTAAAIAADAGFDALLAEATRPAGPRRGDECVRTFQSRVCQ